MSDIAMSDIATSDMAMSDLALGHRPHEPRAPALPVGSIGSQASGYFGVWWVIITEASLFIYLLFSYAYCAMQFPGPWPPSGPPELGLASIDTFILILSSIAVALGEHAIKQGQRARLTLGLAIGCALGLVFVAIQLKEWASKGASLSSNLYYSFYFTTTGFHMAHVAVGVLILGALTIWSALGKFDAARNSPVSIGALYWHFVDAVWIVIFATYYIVPRLR
ncbi:MAG: cytochrome c oxidase subunit [Methylobacteriaceae bacterium]|jgi:heme/copper-type cytochrome/quinol oxidase subunit 3|nr:cytochrome c oxidase subunit [Methylobacteriaceae bacterium]